MSIETLFFLVTVILIFIVVYRNDSGERTYTYLLNQIGSIYDKILPYSYKVVKEKEVSKYLQKIEDKEKTIYEFFSAEEMFWNRTPKELSEITGKFGMTSEFFYSNQKMGSLSGGEKVKAHLMRLIIQDVTVLLLDEPSNDIDINTKPTKR